MEDEMLYEMRIPPGITETMVARVISEFDLDIKPTDEGPVLLGKKEELEKAQDFLLKELNQRIMNLEGKK